jgi:hypothetical protein
MTASSPVLVIEAVLGLQGRHSRIDMAELDRCDGSPLLASRNGTFFLFRRLFTRKHFRARSSRRCGEHSGFLSLSLPFSFKRSNTLPLIGCSVFLVR